MPRRESQALYPQAVQRLEEALAALQVVREEQADLATSTRRLQRAAGRSQDSGEIEAAASAFIEASDAFNSSVRILQTRLEAVGPSFE